MGFRQADSEGRGGFARIWSIEDKGNYSVAKIRKTRNSSLFFQGYKFAVDKDWWGHFYCLG